MHVKPFRIGIAICLAVTIYSCSDKESTNAPTPIQVKSHNYDLTTKAGVVVDTINTRARKDQSYAIYLPSGYDTSKTWMLLAGFDSQAQGPQTTKKYQELAEEYDCILAVSNSSRNGLTGKETVDIAGFMINDLKSRYAVNRDLIFLTGFSGGSRVASSYAIMKGGVAGVIGCGAGLTDKNSAVAVKFEYFGLVGKEDFNLLEMRNLDFLLRRSNVRHHIYEFDGAHEWPDTAVMRKSFVWMKCVGMRKGAINKDTAFINRVEKYAEGKDDFERYANHRYVISCLEGLSTIDHLRTTAREIEQGQEFKAHIQKEAELQKEEQAMQSGYAKAIQREDWRWWQPQLVKLWLDAKDKSDPLKSQMNKRVLNYLSLTSYMYATTAISNDMKGEAKKFLAIYEGVDPENPEVYVLRAKMQAREGEVERALISLRDAYNRGCRDFVRLKRDPDFFGLTKVAEFNSILEAMAKAK